MFLVRKERVVLKCYILLCCLVPFAADTDGTSNWEEKGPKRVEVGCLLQQGRIIYVFMSEGSCLFNNIVIAF